MVLDKVMGKKGLRTINSRGRKEGLFVIQPFSLPFDKLIGVVRNKRKY